MVDHEGLPTPSEVYRDCGQIIFEEWMSQEPCRTNIGSDVCEGYYAHLIGSRPAQKEVTTLLAPATAWISVEGCEPVAHKWTSFCKTIPTFVITGQEPLPGERIVRVEGTFDGKSFICDNSDSCKFSLQETGIEGITVQFWAYSSYGDSSLLFSAQVRVSKVNESSTDQPHWYVDVLSSQWLGQPVAACADWWGSLPPVGGPPDWLTSPARSEDLQSRVAYYYLAANLIMQDAESAMFCLDGGVAPGGAVNPCGLEHAQEAVNEWQNRFDEMIISTSQKTGISANLLKNLFARESQFWPGPNHASGEMGFGHLTEAGADTTLSWNFSFYEQFCPSVLSGERCVRGYMRLKDDERLLLRQSLVAGLNATCAECPFGLDPAKSDFSIDVFAQTLIANCRQTGQVVHNFTGGAPGAGITYEDLWKLTLVNYNAGSGCLGDTLSSARRSGLELTWENITRFLPLACTPAIDYVNDISD
ncbi:MAG TPA: hypothetical protein VK897_25815 [Anaerolineales bacterium]|nr:hypothetical protein [Anaerolineales bacterium]